MSTREKIESVIGGLALAGFSIALIYMAAIAETLIEVTA